MLTSVLAQLQFIAVHRKIFIRSIMTNRIPNATVNHKIQDGLTPPFKHPAKLSIN